jgi:F-box domain
MNELGDLGGFPIELVLEALNNLDIRDLLRCRRVSHIVTLVPLCGTSAHTYTLSIIPSATTDRCVQL